MHGMEQTKCTVLCVHLDHLSICTVINMLTVNPCDSQSLCCFAANSTRVRKTDVSDSGNDVSGKCVDLSLNHEII